MRQGLRASPSEFFAEFKFGVAEGQPLSHSSPKAQLNNSPKERADQRRSPEIQFWTSVRGSASACSVGVIARKRVGRECGGKHFDRDNAPELGVRAAEYFAHATFAKLGRNPVVGNGGRRADRAGYRILASSYRVCRLKTEIYV